MIDKNFWCTVARNWSKKSEETFAVFDQEEEKAKAQGIADEDLVAYDSIWEDKLDDIIAEFDL